ncbi:MAG: AAA family ATPase, partial [Solirubrobacteraceae bacterium]|nr:AAA family ATPase [Solirubrobacteraceae bacterium]
MRPSSGPPRLFERGQELERLTEAVEGARSGRPGLVVIEGPGGIGKTRLLVETRRQAKTLGIRVLSARGDDREQRLPFGIVDQLFAGEPGAREARERPSRGTVEDDADVSFATLAHLHELTERLAAGGPLLLVVDDAHLSDAPSLHFLGYLARRLDRTPVTLVLAIRPFERTDEAALLASLIGDPHAIAVRPAPLSEAATSELIAEGLGQEPDSGFSSTCRRATGGNPLLLGELVKTLRHMQVAPVADGIPRVAELGPRALLRTVLVRLSGLGTDAELLSRAIAVLSDAADLPLAGELAGLDGDLAREAASRLIGAEVLADGAAVRFVHPLVGAAVYETIPAPERDRAHERAAAVLRERGHPA